MGDINWLAVFLAALAAFLLGGLWYSPVMFGTKWADLAQLAAEQQTAANSARTYVLAFALSFIAALVFSLFLGPDPDLGFALAAGFSAGLAWVTGAFAINYLFEQKPFSLFLINGTYHTLQFTAYGLVLGLM